MAKRRRKKSDDSVDLQKTVDQYQEVFNEIGRFTELIRQHDTEIQDAETAAFEAKRVWDEKKAELSQLQQTRDGTKHMLYRFLSPGVGQILPLFDTMEPANEKKHGKGAKKWRKDPLALLRTSPAAIRLLNDADILFIGQLQDRVQDHPNDWWHHVPGMPEPMAASIVDRLNDFLFDKGA